MGLTKPGEPCGLTGTGSGLSRQEFARRVFGRIWNRNDPFLQSKTGPLVGYPDPLLTLARTVPSKISLYYCKRYGGMLKIGLLPSRSTDSPLQIIGYISGSWVSHRTSLLLLLWSWFLSPFLFSTIMSLNRNYQQSGWIVYLVEYSPGYKQSLMWSVAWHHMCGIW
jgi:hypothetical protein